MEGRVMKQNLAWPIAAVVGLGILVFGLSSGLAQRDRPLEGMRPQGQPWRFTVAHANAGRIVILDTATGQLYVANEKDFKPHSDLPRVGEQGRPRPIERDKEPIRREKDRERPKERDKETTLEKDKDKVKPDRD
jgi:hypothetical protein